MSFASALFIGLLCALASATLASTSDDLVAAVTKGDADSVLQQVGHGAHVNEPNTKGNLAIVTAVARSDLKSASVLVNYSANMTQSEPASGLSAITTAFLKSNEPLARLLLQYGADPDAADSKGKTARSLIRKKAEMQALIDQWDAKGAAAFEDPPGTWTRHMHETHTAPFFYNAATGESRYMVPTSCAWTRNPLDGHVVYVNTITHQSVWTRPAALAWKLLHAPGDRSTPYWYNYATDKTSVDTPAELPADLAEEISYDSGTYFTNTVTKEATWEDPAESTWRSVRDPNGRTFWFHPKTGESTWERPVDLAWKTVPTEDGHSYYHNERTEEVTWEKPVVIAWEKAQFNPHVNIMS